MPKPRRKAAPPQPPVVVSGQILASPQEQVWRLANEDIASGQMMRMRRGMAALRGLERELADRMAATEVRRGLDESVLLERARGEKVELARSPDGFSRIRIRTRDGLETLRRSGAIGAAQHRAGLLYRDLYEATDPERDLRSHMESLERTGGAAEPAVAEAWAERRMRLARTVAAIEAKVRLADRNDRAVRVLREVAGHARAIGALSAGGGGQAICKRALVTALDVCAAHFRLA